MKNEEFDIIKKIIINSHNLTDKEVDRLNKTNGWKSLVKEFYDKCRLDEDIVKLYQQIKQIKEILSFDIKQKLSTIQTETDLTIAELKEELLFEGNDFSLAQYIYDNLQEILNKLNGNLTKLEKEILTIKVKQEIQRIKNLIEECQAIAKQFKEAIKKQKLAESYRKSKIDLLKELEEKLKTKLKKHAKTLRVYHEERKDRYISEDFTQ